MRSLSLTAAVIFASALTDGARAQRLFFTPPGNATVEASSRIGFPFGGTAALRYQQICGLSGDTNAIGAINRVAFRRDNDAAVASGDYTAFSPDFKLTVSTAARTTMTMSRAFATNIGADATVVHIGTISWPAEQKVPPGPTPFSYSVPFAGPFPYLSINGDILLDFEITSPNNTNALFFCDAGSNGGGSSARALGAGCPPASNLVSVSSNWGPGTTARILQYNAAGAVPSVLGIGSNANNWLGIPLPFDLSPLGATGCMMYHDNVAYIPGSTSGTAGSYNGRWDLWLDVPANPFLAGLQLRTQFFNLFDTGVQNPLSLSVSAGHEITFATPIAGSPPQSEAHNSGLTGTIAALVQQGYGMVTEFQFQ